MTQIRERELEDEINKLLVEKSDFTKQYESKKLFLDLLVKYKDTQDQLRPESQKEKDIKSDLSGYQTDLTVRMKESIVLGDSLKKKLQERQISEQSLQKEESEVVTQVESLEKQVKEKLVEELRLQQNIEKVMLLLELYNFKGYQLRILNKLVTTSRTDIIASRSCCKRYSSTCRRKTSNC
jgi:hypothetical protein